MDTYLLILTAKQLDMEVFECWRGCYLDSVEIRLDEM